MDRRTAASFAAGAALGAVLTYTAARNSHLFSKLYAAVRHPYKPYVEAVDDGIRDMTQVHQDDVLAEMFTRNVQFFGAEAQSKIAHSFVVVVGLGGVGSHAAHMLLRSGVGRLRIIDFDQVSLSSLNRHAVATRADVGLPKASVLQQHFKQICPEAQVEALNVMYTPEEEGFLLSGNPDYVLDAIDNIDTKVALLAACRRRGLPVVSVAGAGAKADPTRLRVADISESSVDPLARAVRHRLRKEHGIESGVDVVLSTERPRCKLMSADELGSNPLDYQIVPNFRVRTIPVLGTTPAIFGMAAASYMLCQLAGAPYESEPVFKLQGQQYEVQLRRLIEREELRFGTADGVTVDLDEVVYLVRELWRGLSARAPRAILPGGDKGLNRSTANLTLTRWDAARLAAVDNLVLLTFEEAEAHEAAGLAHVRAQDPDWAARVERHLDRARREFHE